MKIIDTLKKFNVTKEKHPCIDSIDFEKLEGFVSVIVHALIARYGKEKVRLEIQRDNSESPIIWIISYIIELGGSKVIVDSNLETNNQQNLQSAAFIAGISLDFALSNELVKHGLHLSGKSNYYDYDTLEILINRIMQHVMDGNPRSRTNLKRHVDDLIQTNIYNRL
jgi:hypothetical protein